jgi:hypothetical protein
MLCLQPPMQGCHSHSMLQDGVSAASASTLFTGCSGLLTLSAAIPLEDDVLSVPCGALAEAAGFNMQFA